MQSCKSTTVHLTIDHVVDEKMRHSLKNIECVVCYELAWPPAIYCGENGHMNVCSKCRPRVTKCPMRCSTKWLQQPTPCMAWSDEAILCRCHCSAECPWTCPIRDYAAKFPKHLEECKHSIRCSCDSIFSSQNQFQQHLFTCPNEIVPCPICQQKMARSQIQSDNHLRICPSAPTRCTLFRCTRQMKRSDLDAHEKNECEFRITSPPVTCELCRNTLRVFEEKSHQEKCPRRVIKCHQCQMEILATFSADHALVCPCRTVTCQACGSKSPLHKIHNHMTKDCLERKVECKRCKITVAFKNMDPNLHPCKTKCELCPTLLSPSEETTHHKERCPGGLVTCGACEKQMTRKTWIDTEHDSICEMKWCRCQEGCEGKVLRRDMPAHLIDKRFEAIHLRFQLQESQQECKELKQIIRRLRRAVVSSTDEDDSNFRPQQGWERKSASRLGWEVDWDQKSSRTARR